MNKFIKRLFCRHKHTKTITNISGDYLYFYKCRSIKLCPECGKIIKDQNPDRNCKICNFVSMD